MSKVIPPQGHVDVFSMGVTYCIHQGYDGSAPSFVTAISCPSRPAIYCQLLAEQMFGPTVRISTLGIACALVAFYGCEPAERIADAALINLRSIRAEYVGTAGNRYKYLELMADPALHREGLVEALRPHIHKEAAHG